MTISSSQIHLLASARMQDAADGGGPMTGQTLQDGVENNVFTDITSTDRVTGALQLRKVYAAVLAAGTDALMDAHVVLDDLPDDAAVAALLIPAADSAQGVAELCAALTADTAFCGAARVTAAVAVASNTVPVSGVRAPLIPKTALAAPVSGGLEESGAQATVVGWVLAGQTVALTVAPIGLTAPAGFTARLAPGSMSGTFTAPGGAGTLAVTAGGVVTLTAPGGYLRNLTFDSDAGTRFISGLMQSDGLTNVAITAQVLVAVKLPARQKRVAAVAGQVVYEIALPVGTVLGSETVDIPGTLGVGKIRGNSTTETFAVDQNPLVNAAFINRSAGMLTVVLAQPLPSGSEILVTYAEGGSTAPLLPAALVNGGVFTGNAATVTPANGMELAGAAFDIAGSQAGLKLLGGVISSGGLLLGSATAAGVITVPGHAGQSIVNWYAAQYNPAYGVSSVSATLPKNIDATTLTITGQTSAGAAFSATANASSVFATAHVTGTYDAATGALALAFASTTRLRSLAYSGTQQQPQQAFAELYGLSVNAFAADGTVPVIKAGQVLVLRHTDQLAAATYANGAAINTGRTDLADVRLVDRNGAGIGSGWSANLVAGTIAVTDISGWQQPVVVRHAIEHMAMALSVPNAGQVLLSRAVTRAFPAGSVLCSALQLGDLQARVGATFAQQSWTAVWSDARIGEAITPRYQEVAHPILVDNLGAVSERWALVFTTTTAFRVIGETVGQVATGDINSTLAPINPATGQPWFTLSALGWGGGWSAGHVLRFNTHGASAPLWVARVVLPSAPSGAADSLTLAVRGDVDA